MYCCVCVSSCLNWNVSKRHADRMFMLPKSQSVSYQQYLLKKHKITIPAPHSQTPVHFYSLFHSYPPSHLFSTFFSVLPRALLLNFQTQRWKFISVFWSLLPPSMGLHEKLSTRSSCGMDSDVLCKHVFIFLSQKLLLYRNNPSVHYISYNVTRYAHQLGSSLMP